MCHSFCYARFGVANMETKIDLNMARIYSTSYFHYTKDLSTLESILQSGFQGYYCREEFKYHNKLINMYIPMVSFCDLPLSHIATMTYGDYIIGMSSTWGNSCLLTPVCYFPPKADNPLTRFISSLAKHFEDGKVKFNEATILAYSKPKRKYVTNGHTRDNYKERECRRAYTPSMTIDETKHHTPCPKLFLSFKETDITFIIVKDEQAKIALIKSIHIWTSVGGNTIANKELLYTKILTKQEIANNF